MLGSALRRCTYSRPSVGEIESKDAFVIARPLQHRRVTQRAAGIVITGAPTLHHAETREFVVLGMAFVVLCPIDQVNDVVDLAVGNGAEQLGFRTVT